MYSSSVEAVVIVADENENMSHVPCKEQCLVAQSMDVPKLANTKVQPLQHCYGQGLAHTCRHGLSM